MRASLGLDHRTPKVELSTILSTFAIITEHRWTGLLGFVLRLRFKTLSFNRVLTDCRAVLARIETRVKSYDSVDEPRCNGCGHQPTADRKNQTRQHQ